MDANPKKLKARPAKEMRFLEVVVEHYNTTTQTTFPFPGLGRYHLLDEQGFSVPANRKHSTLPPADQHAAIPPGSAVPYSVIFEVPAKYKPDKMFYTVGTDRTIVVDLTHVTETKIATKILNEDARPSPAAAGR